MTIEQNKATVRRFYEAFEANDQTALKEVLAEDLAAYSHGATGPQGREVHVQGISMWNAAFETRFTIHDQVAEDDMVASFMTMHATHSRGDFQGLSPTGKQIAADAMSLERVSDGKIVERRVTSDWLSMMQQLGLVPPPQPARA